MNISKELIEKLKVLKTLTIIAISGFGGSGKSSFAKSLGKATNTPVIGVDSFQKDGAFDTEYKLWEIMNFSRLEEEVLIQFTNNEPIIKYGHFDANLKSISETRKIKNNGRVIVEGVGLFRPELMKYFTYKIWVDCPIDIAIDRGKKRDREAYGNSTDKFWDGIWKENDLQYIQTFDPKSLADFVISN